MASPPLQPLFLSLFLSLSCDAGKYTGLQDSYLSVIKSLQVRARPCVDMCVGSCGSRAARGAALSSLMSVLFRSSKTDRRSVISSRLQHAAIAARKRLVIDWIDAAALEPATEAEDAEAFGSSWAMLKAADGVLVPGELRTHHV